MGESPSVYEIRNQYMGVCEELEFSKQVTFLRYAQREEAYQIYQDVIEEQVNTVVEALRLHEDTYASVTRQELIKTLLQTLRTKFSNSDGYALESLNEVYSDISRQEAQFSIKY
jgi:DNA phosphorothioation-dependent restriction protein DptG